MKSTVPGGKKTSPELTIHELGRSATTVRHLKLVLTLVDVDLCLFDVAEPPVSIDGPGFNATHYVHRLLVGLVDIYCVGVELIGSDYRVVESVDMIACLHMSFFDWFV
jgi:hypothetical protein